MEERAREPSMGVADDCCEGLRETFLLWLPVASERVALLATFYRLSVVMFPPVLSAWAQRKKNAQKRFVDKK